MFSGYANSGQRHCYGTQHPCLWGWRVCSFFLPWEDIDSQQRIQGEQQHPQHREKDILIYYSVHVLLQEMSSGWRWGAHKAMFILRAAQNGASKNVPIFQCKHHYYNSIQHLFQSTLKSEYYMRGDICINAHAHDFAFEASCPPCFKGRVPLSFTQIHQHWHSINDRVYGTRPQDSKLGLNQTAQCVIQAKSQLLHPADEGILMTSWRKRQ